MHLPTFEELRELEPDEIGFLILRWLRAHPHRMGEPTREGPAPLSMSTIDGMYSYRAMALPASFEIPQLLAEGWQWLEHAGLTVPDTRQSNPVFKVLSRRGRAIETRKDFDEFNVLRLLPEPLIHPAIRPRVRERLLRQDFEGAVFAAFREVEISVRDKTEFDAKVVGTDLMRQAFRKAGGPLTDMSITLGEREGMEHVFAGAIGAFKNPGSHRTVPYAADEAVELVVLASRLLKIVDQRAGAAVREDDVEPT